MIRITQVNNYWNGNLIDLNNGGSSIITAGDITTHELTIEESIVHDTEYAVVNPKIVVCNLATDPPKVLTFMNFEHMNGFAVGQVCTLTKYVVFPTNNPIDPVTITATIEAIDYTSGKITFDALFTPFSENSGVYGALNTWSLQIYTEEFRNNFFLNLSYRPNGYPYINNRLVSTTNAGYWISQVQNVRKSPLDQHECRFWCEQDTATFAVNDEVNLTHWGWFSSNGSVTAKLKRLADVNTYTRKWKVTIELINIMHQLNDLGNPNIILYSDIEWYTSQYIVPNPSITEQPTVLQHDLMRMTIFDTASGGLASQVASLPTQDLYFDEESQEIEVIIGGNGSPPSGEIYFGAAWLPQNPLLFQPYITDQTTICMMLPTTQATVGNYQSTAFSDGSQFEIEITYYNYSAGVHTVRFKMRPYNTEFEDFMFNRGDGDRYFNLWMKAGQITHLIYNRELIDFPKPVVLLDDYNYGTDWATLKLDNETKGYNINDSFNGTYLVKPRLSTADNAYLRFDLIVPKNIHYQKFTFQIIVAEIADLTNFFQLETYTVDLTDLPYNDVTGKTLFDVTLNAYNVGKSNFNNLRLRSESLYDNFTKQGLVALLPIVIDWRYWLPQAVSILFNSVGKNTKDWQSYFNAPNSFFGDYGLFLKTKLESETFEAEHYTGIYDLLQFDETFTDTLEEWQGSATISYKLNSTGQVLPNLIIGSLVKVEITVTTGQKVIDYWGQLTIEEKEQGARYTITTNYDIAPTNENPLLPLDGETRLKSEVTGDYEIVYSCIVDTSVLNGDNYVITLKHWNEHSKIEQVRLKFDTPLTFFEGATDVNESDVLSSECCEVLNVYANPATLDTEINDVTLILGKQFASYDDYEFIITDGNSIDVTSIAVQDSINNNEDKFGVVEWREILDEFGVGCYKIYIRVTQNAIVTDYLYGTYELNVFSVEAVRGTVKINSVFGSKIAFTNTPTINAVYWMDFTGMSLLDSLRFPGFFGKRKPKPVINNIILSDRSNVKTYREFINEYELRTNPIQKHLSSRLIDLHLLNENNMYIWDYNSFNHEYYSKKRLILKEIADPIYKEFSNKAEFIAVLGEKYLYKKSGY